MAANEPSHSCASPAGRAPSGERWRPLRRAGCTAEGCRTSRPATCITGKQPADNTSGSAACKRPCLLMWFLILTFFLFILTVWSHFALACRGLSVLELALKQTGPACVKRAADYAQRAAAAEGSNAGIIKVGYKHIRQLLCMHCCHFGACGSHAEQEARGLAFTAMVCVVVLQAVVREGEQYMDHPVHLGGEAFVLTELKVTPPVEKKQPGRWVCSVHFI